MQFLCLRRDNKPHLYYTTHPLCVSVLPPGKKQTTSAPHPTSSTDNISDSVCFIVREHVLYILFNGNNIKVFRKWRWFGRVKIRVQSSSEIYKGLFTQLQMVLLLSRIPPSTGDEELYIQQAVVFIEDAIQVCNMTSECSFA